MNRRTNKCWLQYAACSMLCYSSNNSDPLTLSQNHSLLSHIYLKEYNSFSPVLSFLPFLIPAHAEMNAWCNAFKYKQELLCNLSLGSSGGTNTLIFRK